MKHDQPISNSYNYRIARRQTTESQRSHWLPAAMSALCWGGGMLSDCCSSAPDCSVALRSEQLEWGGRRVAVRLLSKSWRQARLDASACLISPRLAERLACIPEPFVPMVQEDSKIQSNGNMHSNSKTREQNIYCNTICGINKATSASSCCCYNKLP